MGRDEILRDVLAGCEAWVRNEHSAVRSENYEGGLILGWRLRLWDLLRQQYGVEDGFRRRKVLACALAGDSVRRFWDPTLERPQDRGVAFVFIETCASLICGSPPAQSLVDRARGLSYTYEPYSGMDNHPIPNVVWVLLGAIELAEEAADPYGPWPELWFKVPPANPFRREVREHPRPGWYEATRYLYEEVWDDDRHLLIDDRDLKEPVDHDIECRAAWLWVLGPSEIENLPQDKPAARDARQAFWLHWLHDLVPKILTPSDEYMRLLDEYRVEPTP